MKSQFQPASLMFLLFNFDEIDTFSDFIVLFYQDKFNLFLFFCLHRFYYKCSISVPICACAIVFHKLVKLIHEPKVLTPQFFLNF